MNLTRHAFSNIFLLFIPIFLSGQIATEPQKLADFAYMIGEWQGKGTYYSQQGTTEFNVHESITFGVDSTLVLINGQGHDENGVKGHDAFGVLFFDAIEKEFRIHAFTMQGQNVIAYVNQPGETSFEWGFETPGGGKIKYTASISDSKWEEAGTYTPPGGSQSYPTVSMKLVKTQ